VEEENEEEVVAEGEEEDEEKIKDINNFFDEDDSVGDECIPVNILMGNEESYDCCMEYGIVCDEKHITEIYLGYSEISGSIPPEIGNLPELNYLNLRNNKLTGSIPPEIGKLTKLETIDLGFNNLTGTIPPEIGKITKLELLYLPNNNLIGSIPSELGNLFNLTNLKNNNLTGTIPNELGKLTKLEELNVENNDLNGSIPSEISKIKHLNINNNPNINEKSSSPKTILLVSSVVVVSLFIGFFGLKYKKRIGLKYQSPSETIDNTKGSDQTMDRNNSKESIVEISNDDKIPDNATSIDESCIIEKEISNDNIINENIPIDTANNCSLPSHSHILNISTSSNNPSSISNILDNAWKY
ncbi:hypothetical protein PIROE2DRAFT_19031, partial [Piromyces sp. E2]